MRMRVRGRRGQPRTWNWIPIAPGIQFSARPATWNEQNSNSFHLSEFGRRGAGNVPRLPHSAGSGIRNVSASILRIIRTMSRRKPSIRYKFFGRRGIDFLPARNPAAPITFREIYDSKIGNYWQTELRGRE